MFPYLSAYFINIIASSFSYKRWGWVPFSIFVVFLVAVLGLRGESVGVDTANYYYSFWVIESGNSDIKDPLYYFIVKTVSSIGFGPELVVFVFSAITIFPLALLIYKESPYPALSFAVLLAFGFYAFYFNGMRQGASITFGVLFVGYLLRDEKGKAGVSLFISIMLHLSAIVLIPVYVIYKLSSRGRVYIVMALWPISIVSAFNEAVFFSIVSSLSFLVPGRFLSYIQVGDISDKGLSFVFDQIVFWFLFFVLLNTADRKSGFYVFLGMLGIEFLYLFSGVKYVDRLAFYYYVFCVLALPFAISRIKGRGVRLGVVIGLVLLLAVQFSYRAYIDPHFIFPYYTVFGEK